jgi:hypothetical protein
VKKKPLLVGRTVLKEPVSQKALFMVKKAGYQAKRLTSAPKTGTLRAINRGIVYLNGRSLFLIGKADRLLDAVQNICLIL